MIRRISAAVLVVAIGISAGLVSEQKATEQDLLKRIASQPNDIAPYLDLTNLYVEQNRLTEAEQVMSRGLTAVRQKRVLAGQPGPPAPACGSDFGTPLRVGGDIPEPTKLKHVAPAYPAAAQVARVQGVVIVEATISPDGTVSDAKVLRSVPMLDQAAVDAVRQWVFQPTLMNGKAVPIVMTVTVNFSLNEITR